jgi:hypothetical protein
MDVEDTKRCVGFRVSGLAFRLMDVEDTKHCVGFRV